MPDQSGYDWDMLLDFFEHLRWSLVAQEIYISRSCGPSELPAPLKEATEPVARLNKKRGCILLPGFTFDVSNCPPGITPALKYVFHLGLAEKRREQLAAVDYLRPLVELIAKCQREKIDYETIDASQLFGG